MADKPKEENESTRSRDTSREAEVRSELVGLEVALTKFSRSFEASAHRWEMLVYPAMLVFFIMATSGFYLIYSLTVDMHTLANHVDPQMAENLDTMSTHIEHLSGNIHDMTGRIAHMSDSIDHINMSIGTMNVTMGDISYKMDPLLENIADMNFSMRQMTTATGIMSRDMSNMNYNIGKPMSIFPW